MSTGRQSTCWGCRAISSSGAEIGQHLGLPFPAAALAAQTSRVVRLPGEMAEIGPEGRANARVRVRVVPLGHHAGMAACFGVLLDEVAEGRAGRVGSTRGEQRTSAALRGTLSPRELDVLRLLADGLDVRAISTELRISIHTARYYVKSILRKLDVRTQAQAVAVALRGGLPEIS